MCTSGLKVVLIKTTWKYHEVKKQYVSIEHIKKKNNNMFLTF